MRNGKAFLLVEVMLAMVMVTTGLLFVGRVYSLAKSVMDRSRALFASSLLLEQKMFDLQSSDEVYGAGPIEFPDNRGCYWEVRTTELTDKGPKFFKVNLGVSLLLRKTRPDTYRLETYLVKSRPEPSK